MWNDLQDPVCPEDIFELPVAQTGKVLQKKKQKKKIFARKFAAGIGIGLALMAPAASYAADLFISGGGGGASSSAVTVSGGTYAGAGQYCNGGGAYIGDGTQPVSGATHSIPYSSTTDTTITAEDGGTSSPYQGGSAKLTEANLTGFETINVHAGDGGASSDTTATAGKGGDATLSITGLLKGNLNLQDGQTYTTQNLHVDAGKAYANIGTWDARDKDTTFTNDQTSQVIIKHIKLGNSRTFTITNSQDNYSIGQYSVYDQATFKGDLDAQNKIINFYLSDAVKNGYTMLAVDGNANITSSTVNMAFSGASTPLVKDDKVVLIDVTSGTLSGEQANQEATATITQGVSLIYKFNLRKENNQLIATLAGTEAGFGTGAATPEPVVVNPKTKAFSQGRLAQLAFIAQGADLTSQGVKNAMLGLPPDFAYDVVPFFIGQGGKSRYETGSHIDVDGMALTTGLAWRGQATWGFPVLAAFFEAGWGNFKTSLDASHGDAKGKGDLSYYGAGLLGHMDFKPLGPGSFYAEASFRTGYSYIDFQTRNIRDGFGRTADFESSAPYYGLHAGLGYKLKFNDLLGLEVYSKYFWTHLAADEVDILGDPFEFEALDSQRWRNGLRLSFYIPTENYLLEPFIGAAWEYEFAGYGGGSVHGYTMEDPSIKGGTGIGEIGLSLYPADHDGLSLDMAVSGYTGRREGVSGDIRLKWEF